MAALVLEGDVEAHDPIVELRWALVSGDLLVEGEKADQHSAHCPDAVRGGVSLVEELGAADPAEAVVVGVVGEQVEDLLGRGRDGPRDVDGPHQAPARVETTAS